jgi:hypothetical protein
MASQKAEEERRLSLAAHRPRHIINGMIQTAAVVKPPTIHRASPSSLLGTLETLPLELLHAIFALLDFQSLSHISATCLRGIEVVKSLPEYRNLTSHAPLTLAALGKTRLIRHHTATSLHTALLSPLCTSCNQYGAFLFLPTCQRCCYHCLWKNQSLWVIPLALARKCFSLSAAEANSMPNLRSIPGKYFVGHSICRQRSAGLVSVSHAKQLSFKIHDSQEQMRLDLEAQRSRLPISDFHTFRFLQQAPLVPPGLDLSIQPEESNVPNDRYCGMASVPFPYLRSDGQVEHGFWCLGCEVLRREWWGNDPIPEQLAHLLLPGCRADNVVNSRQDIARSRAEMLCHIDQCPEARSLIHVGAELRGELDEAYNNSSGLRRISIMVARKMQTFTFDMHMKA